MPETLMPALAELEQAWLSARQDPAYRSELDGLLRDFAGRPTRCTGPAGSPSARDGRSTSSARTSTTPARTSSTTRSARCCWRSAWASAGSSPRRAPASTASRPRPSARCWASSASSTWASRTRIRQRPNVQRMQLLGATRPAGRRGCADAQGGDLGGDPRLGHATSRDTHYVIGSVVGPGALSGARARPAARDRRRGRAGRSSSRRAGCRAGHRLRRRRLERDGHLRRVPPGRRASSWSASRPAARGSTPPPRGAADGRRPARHPARLALGGDAGRGGPDPRGALDLGRPRLPGRRPRSTRTCATAAGPATSRSTTPTRSRPSARSRAWRGSSPRSRPPTRSRGCSPSPDGDARPRLPLGPRRQGPRRGARRGRRVSIRRRHGRRPDRSRVRGQRQARGADALRDGRLSDARGLAADRRGLRAGGCRRDRARRALLGPARRRPGDPRRGHRGARRRRQHRRGCWRSRGRSSASVPVVLMCYANMVFAPGAQAFVERARRRRAPAG